MHASGALDVRELNLEFPMQVVHTNDSKELNYGSMEEEHRRLLGVIREATSETRSEPADRLVLRAQVWHICKKCIILYGYTIFGAVFIDRPKKISTIP